MRSAPAIGCAALFTAAVLSGCTAPPQAPAPPSAPTVATADVEVIGGQVRRSAERFEIPLGRVVRLTVRSDRADELHVHGYDKSARLSPGVPAVVEFRADIPGVFEVELHDSGLALPSLEVR
ncbi:hypothetical protein MOQ72_22840 [Saccharopolyspora sp. K220]|uniref:hypothetical protein n=1 Tax=Saccharopolyspora soli TaxID=2926618 RepID=UPI001F5996C5|nr:hypothetical protein [Saccharopolyspora soli]MCI2420285.1 hypothetical protein [Saccharopolyspora soli]